MPDHVFEGPYETVYPESRDARDIHLGTVAPGDIRDTDGPIDQHWRLATDEDREALRKRAEARRLEAEAAAVGGESGIHGNPDLEVLRTHPGTGEEMHGTEHPADGTLSPPASNEPLPRRRKGTPDSGKAGTPPQDDPPSETAADNTPEG